ncbi:MAG TPA: hypothetical protein VIL20_10690 [Sandaracinaceae bacterium]
MRRAFVALLVAALPPTALAQGSRPECIRVEAIVRWGADAYNHFVRVENRCDRRARCRVSTNVNPEPQTIEVDAGQSVEVITFRGSPAREHTPHVDCELL